MKVNPKNPYKAKGKIWLKGSLHTHTNLSHCGRVPVAGTLKLYEKNKFGFLAVTDHGIVSIPVWHKTKLTMLAGIEVDYKGKLHTLLISPDIKKIKYDPKLPHQKLIDVNRKNGCLVILNHPDWQLKEHYPIDYLLKMKNFNGIEIYNGVIERLQGSALSTAKWDRLLAKGKYVLGFANHDFHLPKDLKSCCNIVRVKKKTPGDVFKALVTGNFYCYYGVEIKDIGRKGGTVYIKTKNARLIRFFGFGGVLLKKVKGKSAQIKFRDISSNDYIRIEALGTGGEISWSQPFFR